MPDRKPTKSDLWDVTTEGKFVFFWGGWPSQWYPEGEKKKLPATFTIDGQRYTHAEQWMMAEKARLFGDDVTLAKILKAKYPKAQKKLGREVRGFNAKTWDKHADRIVYEGNLAKFGQNDKLRALLLATGTKTIVEASPDDTIWGIGLLASDPRSRDRKKWLGDNRLGKALMKVRKALAKG